MFTANQLTSHRLLVAVWFTGHNMCAYTRLDGEHFTRWETTALALQYPLDNVNCVSPPPHTHTYTILWWVKTMSSFLWQYPFWRQLGVKVIIRTVQPPSAVLVTRNYLPSIFQEFYFNWLKSYFSENIRLLKSKMKWISHTSWPIVWG